MVTEVTVCTDVQEIETSRENILLHLHILRVLRLGTLLLTAVQTLETEARTREM